MGVPEGLRDALADRYALRSNPRFRKLVEGTA